MELCSVTITIETCIPLIEQMLDSIFIEFCTLLRKPVMHSLLCICIEEESTSHEHIP